MDVIKLLPGRERPITLRIIDVEAAIRRRPARLNRTEVCTNNFRIGEILRHFEGPFGGSSAYVEDAARGWSGAVVAGLDRGAVELAAEC